MNKIGIHLNPFKTTHKTTIIWYEIYTILSFNTRMPAPFKYNIPFLLITRRHGKHIFYLTRHSQHNLKTIQIRKKKWKTYSLEKDLPMKWYLASHMVSDSSQQDQKNWAKHPVQKVHWQSLQKPTLQI